MIPCIVISMYIPKFTASNEVDFYIPASLKSLCIFLQTKMKPLSLAKYRCVFSWHFIIDFLFYSACGTAK